MKTLMNEIHTIEEFEACIKQAKTTVIVFSAEYCPDCQFLKTFIGKLIVKYSMFDFEYVDTQALPEVAKYYDVLGIPSFLIFSNGEEIGRFVSRFRKAEAEVDTFLAKNVE